MKETKGFLTNISDLSRGRGGLKPDNDVVFEREDIEILNEVLDIVPELKICALAVKLHRKQGSRYPITDRQSLFDLFDGPKLAIANHLITREVIERYVHDSIFPINNDQALMRVVYLALGACNADLNWALKAPQHAYALLSEIRKDLSKSQGGL